MLKTRPPSRLTTSLVSAYRWYRYRSTGPAPAPVPATAIFQGLRPSTPVGLTQHSKNERGLARPRSLVAIMTKHLSLPLSSLPKLLLQQGDLRLLFRREPSQLRRRQVEELVELLRVDAHRCCGLGALLLS